MEQFPDGDFLGVRNQFFILPLIAEGGLTPQGFTQLGPDRNRGGHPIGDLLPFPLGHGRDHGIEETTGRGGGVDGLLEGDQIGVVLPEDIGKF